MSELDSSTVATLADLRPADPALMDEVRELASTLTAVIAQLSPDSRASQLVGCIDRALAEGGRPEDTGTVGFLLVPLLDPNCRATACSRIPAGPEARAHLDLWLHITRYTLGVPPERLPLTIAGFAAARAGATGLARDCYDQAMRGAPALADTRVYSDALDRRTAPEYLRPHYQLP